MLGDESGPQLQSLGGDQIRKVGPQSSQVQIHAHTRRCSLSMTTVCISVSQWAFIIINMCASVWGLQFPTCVDSILYSWTASFEGTLWIVVWSAYTLYTLLPCTVDLIHSMCPLNWTIENVFLKSRPSRWYSLLYCSVLEVLIMSWSLLIQPSHNKVHPNTESRRNQILKPK